MIPTPTLALSLRQPWAWLVVNAGKDIENRKWPTTYRGPFLIHAAKGMTQEEYSDVAKFLVTDINFRGRNVVLPKFEELERGGIVGQAEIVDCVKEADSPWFFGPYGFKLVNIQKLPFRPCRGTLGFFPCNV